MSIVVYTSLTLYNKADRVRNDLVNLCFDDIISGWFDPTSFDSKTALLLFFSSRLRCFVVWRFFLIKSPPTGYSLLLLLELASY